LIKYDDFLCEAVKDALKTINHPLSFFQEPAPIVPRDQQAQAEPYSQWKMVEEQVEYGRVEQGRYRSTWSPEHTGPDESDHESYANEAGGNIVALVVRLHLGNGTQFATELREDEEGIDK
jgi:hypothetical protein